MYEQCVDVVAERVRIILLGNAFTQQSAAYDTQYVGNWCENLRSGRLLGGSHMGSCKIDRLLGTDP